MQFAHYYIVSFKTFFDQPFVQIYARLSQRDFNDFLRDRQTILQSLSVMQKTMQISLT